MRLRLSEQAGQAVQHLQVGRNNGVVEGHDDILSQEVGVLDDASWRVPQMGLGINECKLSARRKPMALFGRLKEPRPSNTALDSGAGPQALLKALDMAVADYLARTDRGDLVLPACKRRPDDV